MRRGSLAAACETGLLLLACWSSQDEPLDAVCMMLLAERDLCQALHRLAGAAMCLFPPFSHALAIVQNEAQRLPLALSSYSHVHAFLLHVPERCMSLPLLVHPTPFGLECRSGAAHFSSSGKSE